MGLRNPSRVCPPLWRLSLLQCLVWFPALLLCALYGLQYLPSVFWAGLLTLLAQGFWIWRSLRGFGRQHYLAATLSGLFGKWTIILVGLILLWGSDLDISVAVTVVTVFVLNTLAAVMAPVLISSPHSAA